MTLPYAPTVPRSHNRTETPAPTSASLLDTLHGDASLFVRSNEIEQSWSIMDLPIEGLSDPLARPPKSKTSAARALSLPTTSLLATAAPGSENASRTSSTVLCGPPEAPVRPGTYAL